MPLPKEKAWFPVKTCGRGWGIPTRWQGWVVTVGFLVALFAGTPLVKMYPPALVGHNLVLAGILVAICYRKGERSGWHWGQKE